MSPLTFFEKGDENLPFLFLEESEGMCEFVHTQVLRALRDSNPVFGRIQNGEVRPGCMGAVDGHEPPFPSGRRGQAGLADPRIFFRAGEMSKLPEDLSGSEQ